jgi:hypothetical protein
LPDRNEWVFEEFHIVQFLSLSLSLSLTPLNHNSAKDQNKMVMFTGRRRFEACANWNLNWRVVGGYKKIFLVSSG